MKRQGPFSHFLLAAVSKLVRQIAGFVYAHHTRDQLVLFINHLTVEGSQQKMGLARLLPQAVEAQHAGHERREFRGHDLA